MAPYQTRRFSISTWGTSNCRESDLVDLIQLLRSLCDKGFLFLWVINSQLQLGLECLKKWGYTYTDRVRGRTPEFAACYVI